MRAYYTPPEYRRSLADLVEDGRAPVPLQQGGDAVDRSAAPPPWDTRESSTMAPRIVQRDGRTYLTEHGNERYLDPSILEDEVDAQGRPTGRKISQVEAGTRYRDRFWSQYPTGFQPGVGPQRNEDYRSSASQSATTAQTTQGDQSRSGGRGGGYQYTGFDFQQDAANRDITKSAKYAFAEATRQAEAAGAGNIWTTKAGAQHFASQYVKPFLEAQGFQVLEIIGDKMRIVTAEDRAAGNTAGTWIDFVVNADGDNPALAWQAEQERSAFGTLETPYDTSAFGGTPATTATKGSEDTGNRGTEAPTSSPYGVDAAAYEELADPTLYDLTYAEYRDRATRR